MDGGRWKKCEQMQCKDPERLCESQWFDSESFWRTTEQKKEWKFIRIWAAVDLQ